MPYVHKWGDPLHRAELHLRASDPLFNKHIPQQGRCLLLEQQGNYFHVLVKTIIDQQLAVQAAAQIAARLQIMQGGMQFSPHGILALTATRMREAGLSQTKIDAIRSLALAEREATICFHSLDSLENDQVMKLLTGFKGIGPWTAEVFLMFGLGRLDILPLGDLGLRNAIKRYYCLPEKASQQDYIAVAEKWRPYRSVASWYLWKMVD